jgi:hypothetical protein
MNPEIGNFISSLFYDSKIHNGEGTDKQDVFVQGFPNPVTIIDTSGQEIIMNHQLVDLKATGIYAKQDIYVMKSYRS